MAGPRGRRDEDDGMARHRPLPREFYARSAAACAPELLGKLLVHETPEGVLSGVIVETEAYVAENDPANHAHRGRTERNSPMFGPPGRAYVYFIYGMHHCLNAVCEREGVPEAVLMRALEPMEGIEVMRRRRAASRYRDLTRGPARLCEALGITTALNAADLTAGPLYIAEGPQRHAERPVVRTTRVGVIAARERRLRWYFRDSDCVSKR